MLEILWLHEKKHLNLNKLPFEDFGINANAYLESSLIVYGFETCLETPLLGIHGFSTKFNLIYLFCFLLFPALAIIPESFVEIFCFVLCSELEYMAVIIIGFCFQGFCQRWILVG